MEIKHKGTHFAQLFTSQYTSSLFSFLSTAHSSSQSQFLIILLSPPPSTSTGYVPYPGPLFLSPNLTHNCLSGPTQGPSSNLGVFLLGILQTHTKSILCVRSVIKQKKQKEGDGGEKWGTGKTIGQLNQSVEGMYKENWMMPSCLFQAVWVYPVSSKFRQECLKKWSTARFLWCTAAQISDYSNWRKFQHSKHLF